MGALAAFTGSPLLLTAVDRVPSEVLSEVRVLQPATIYIAGGAGAVSTAAQAELHDAAPGAVVVRLAGKDRYETAAKIAQEFPAGSPAFVTTGLDYPDALAAGAAAGKMGGAIILTPGFQAGSAALGALQSLHPSSVTAVGGKWSAAAKTAVQEAAGVSSLSVVSGKDRYATSAKVAQEYWGSSPERLLYAVGNGYADAMVGVTAAAAFDAPIILTTGGCRPASVKAVGAKQTSVALLGGEGVLSDFSYNTDCITPTQESAAPRFLNGAYTFDIPWVGQQGEAWSGPASAYMVLSRLGWTRSVNDDLLTQAALAGDGYLQTDENGLTSWPLDSMAKGIRNWTGKSLYARMASPSADQLRQKVLASVQYTGRPVMVHMTLGSGQEEVGSGLDSGLGSGSGSGEENSGTDQEGSKQDGATGFPAPDLTPVMVIDSYDPVADTVTVVDPAGGTDVLAGGLGLLVDELDSLPSGGEKSFTMSVEELAGYLFELGIYY